jgi:HAMP domain-containing protein
MDEKHEDSTETPLQKIERLYDDWAKKTLEHRVQDLENEVGRLTMLLETLIAAMETKTNG